MSINIKTTLKSYASIILITLLGLGLRIWNLTSISLWHDEAFSALLIRYSWGEMMYRIGLDVHPPMYYIFLRFWSEIFGHSLFALRGMSVLFGVGTIIITYFFVNYIFNNKQVAVLAAFLVAVNPFQVQYVTEARMYTMGAFFAISSAFALSAALRNQVAFYVNASNTFLQTQLRKKFFAYYGIFVLMSAILIYTHYYLLFTVAAIGFYGLLFCIFKFKTEFKKYVWVILSGILILVSFLPWLKVFMFQFKQVGAGYWIPPMNVWSMPSTLWELLLLLPSPNKLEFSLVTILTLLMVYSIIRKAHVFEKWLILAGFLAPFGGAMLFLLLAKLQGNDSSVYLVRYFIFSSSFLLIITAYFLANFRIKQIGKILAVLLVAVNIFAIWNSWKLLDVNNREGMAKASQYLNANVEPQHKLFVGSSFEFFNFKYYNRTNVTPLLFTDGHLTHQLPHFAGTAILTDQDLVLNFQEATRHGDIVWLIWTNGFGGSKPTVPENWVQIDEKGFAEVKPYVGTWIIVTEYKVN